MRGRQWARKNRYVLPSISPRDACRPGPWWQPRRARSFHLVVRHGSGWGWAVLGGKRFFCESEADVGLTVFSLAFSPSSLTAAR